MRSNLFDQKENEESEEKIEVNSRFETERKHLERRNDILDTAYDIEFDTMENKEWMILIKLTKLF